MAVSQKRSIAVNQHLCPRTASPCHGPQRLESNKKFCRRVKNLNIYKFYIEEISVCKIEISFTAQNRTPCYAFAKGHIDRSNLAEWLITALSCRFCTPTTGCVSAKLRIVQRPGDASCDHLDLIIFSTRFRNPQSLLNHHHPNAGLKFFQQSKASFVGGKLSLRSLIAQNEVRLPTFVYILSPDPSRLVAFTPGPHPRSQSRWWRWGFWIHALTFLPSLARTTSTVVRFRQIRGFLTSPRVHYPKRIYPAESWPFYEDRRYHLF